MSISRRDFVIGCSAAVAALAGARISNLAFAQNGDTNRDTLVVLFLRGGCDGLSLVSPAEDPDYVASRSEVRVPTSGQGAGISINNTIGNTPFWLHPNAAPLKELYDDQSLAIIHACGLTNGTRSHFEAMEYMERGVATDTPTAAGWLTRHLQLTGVGGTLPAIAASSSTPESLQGSSLPVALTDPNNFKVNGDGRYASRQQATLYTAYSGTTALHRAGRSTLDAITKVQDSLPKDQNGNPAGYTPEKGAKYEGGPGNALQTVARLIKMDVGLRVATVDYGGWDTHESQNWVFPNLVNTLSRALSAFYNDLHNSYNKLTVVVMSEFGRRVKANRSGGTDHGHGNVMFVLGGYVNGGRMYGEWKGLGVEQLDNRVDLAITTDYRTVLGEILTKRMGNPAVDQVFPQFTGFAPIGVLRADGQPNQPPSGFPDAPVNPQANSRRLYLPVTTR